MTFTSSALTLMLLISATCAQQAEVVQTTLGPVQGLRQTVLGKDYDVYWGIPFAKPPLGDLRFKRPEPAEPWTGTLSADTKPNSCYQVVDAFAIPDQAMWKINTPTSEDCLYLNIWIPRAFGPQPPKTTMVWIYGGGFLFGSSTVDLYNGAKLAVTENVIVASMNYRLGPLGFLYTGTIDAPGNQGLLDQALALKWIYDNIVNLGGQQNSITIFGESAGGISVGLHLLSPVSMNYFTRAIMQSGVPILPGITQSVSTATDAAQRLAEMLKCPQDSVTTMLQCLRQVSAENMTNVQWNSATSAKMGPMVDGHFLLEEPQQLLAKGAIKDTQVLTGVNKDEGVLFLVLFSSNPLLPSNLRNMTQADFKSAVGARFGEGNVVKALLFEYAGRFPPDERDSWIDIADDVLGDLLFVCPTLDFATAFTSLKGRRDVYVYSYQHQMSNIRWPDWMGSIHGSEIGAVFGLPQEFNYTRQERSMARRMTGYWSRFAMTGNPNQGRDMTWPKLTPQGASYLKITADGDSAEQGLRYQQCKFRSTILPLLQQCAVDKCQSSSSPSPSLSHITLVIVVCFLVGYGTQ